MVQQKRLMVCASALGLMAGAATPAPAALGYVPAWSSADAIRSEVAAILSQGS